MADSANVPAFYTATQSAMLAENDVMADPANVSAFLLDENDGQPEMYSKSAPGGI